MRKLTVTLIFIYLVIALTGCASNNKTQSNKEIPKYEHTDSFTPLDKQPENNEENQSIEVNENYSDLDEEESTEDNIENHNEQYNDVFESNIEVDLDKLDIDLSTIDWFETPEDTEFYYNVYQWIAYAIQTYYNENVTETFKCNIPDDITEEITNMIFKVNVKGETTDLSILLDMYNNKIVVEQVNQ